MPALDQNQKVACDKCGTLVSKPDVAKHKTKCSVETIYCSQCPNFSTKSQIDSNYHIAKKYEAPKPKIVHTCKECKEDFTGFYALRQLKSKVHVQSFKTTGDFSPLLDAIDDDNLKEDQLPCQQFLVDSQLEKGRQKTFQFCIGFF